MTGFPDAPPIGPGCELPPTIDGGTGLHEELVAEAVLEPAAAVVAAAELVDGLEVGEEAEALELDVALARASAREENLYVAGERLAVCAGGDDRLLLGVVDGAGARGAGLLHRPAPFMWRDSALVGGIA